jgi:hypothetical protein
MRFAYNCLLDKCIKPDLIIAAQTDFLWSDAPVEKWVVARSWPITLFGYLEKIFTIKSQSLFPRVRDLVFWYRIDHKAYKKADKIIAISEALCKDLRKYNYPAFRLYPPMGSFNVIRLHKANDIIKIITVAQSLDDRIKQIPWLVKQLKKIRELGIMFEFTLIGNFNSSIQAELLNILPDIKLTGRLSRDKVIAHMDSSDIFLFASLKENWGYVTVEAMSRGISVFTPNIYPFTETNPNIEFRFEPNDSDDFIAKFMKIIYARKFEKQGAKNFDYWFCKFSHDVFCKRFALIHDNVYLD